MSDILHQPTVLILNRAWQAINTRSVQGAILQLAADAATALDIDGDSMVPVKWEDWIKLPIRPQDQVIHTPKLSIRVPTAVVLCSFSRVPKKRPRFSSRGIFERDNYTCQYCGRKFDRRDLSLDHVFPRDRRGPTNWENIVCSCRNCNTKKRNRLPHEAGMKLLRKPMAPKEVPVTLFIQNTTGVKDWELFLSQ